MYAEAPGLEISNRTLSKVPYWAVEALSLRHSGAQVGDWVNSSPEYWQVLRPWSVQIEGTCM